MAKDRKNNVIFYAIKKKKKRKSSNTTAKKAKPHRPAPLSGRWPATNPRVVDFGIDLKRHNLLNLVYEIKGLAVKNRRLSEQRAP